MCGASQRCMVPALVCYELFIIIVIAVSHCDVVLGFTEPAPGRIPVTFVKPLPHSWIIVIITSELECYALVDHCYNHE